MIDTSVIALVSVIATMVVAFVGPLVTSWMTARTEREKWRREQQRIERDRIENAAEMIISAAAQLGAFCHYVRSDEHTQPVWEEFLKDFYVWYGVVWSYLDENRRTELSELKNDIQDSFRSKLWGRYPQWIPSIIDYTSKAVSSIG